MNEYEKEIAKGVGEAVKDTLELTTKPAAESTGSLIALPIRAIRAALLPLEEWVVLREHKLKKLETFLAEELKGTPEQDIVTPPPHIAVPLLQAASYSFDCDELRIMYAKLLAISMNTTCSSNAHPAFIEVIKQLSPKEARLIKEYNMGVNLVAFTLSQTTKGVLQYEIKQNMANRTRVYSVSEGNLNEHDPLMLSNLERLGLITNRHNLIKKYNDFDFAKYFEDKAHIYLPTGFGKAFYYACVDEEKKKRLFV